VDASWTTLDPTTFWNNQTRSTRSYSHSTHHTHHHTHTQPVILTLRRPKSHSPTITQPLIHSRNIHSRNLNMLPSPVFDFKLLYWAIYRSKVLISIDKSSLQAHKKINGMKFERNCSLSEFWAHFLSFFLPISLP